MSGTCWRQRARDLVLGRRLADLPVEDREAIEACAEAHIPWEPYFRTKIAIVRAESKKGLTP